MNQEEILRQGFGSQPQIPISYKVIKIKKESHDTNTYFFRYNHDNPDERLKNFKPGQFIMLWFPGIDEKPFTISYLEKDIFGITVESRGKTTTAANKSIKVGDIVGIRGPYGSSFTPKNNSVIVAGGLGIVPIRTLATSLKKKKCSFTLIQGAHCDKDLLFKDDLIKLTDDYELCTDDGSCGVRCFTPTLLETYLKNKRPSIVYSVGPEIMMIKVLDICKRNNIDCEMSLERYMKCGFGICGACTCDDKLVCLDGPVFNKNQLLKIKDFNKYAYLKDGKKVTVKEFFYWHE